jgi:uncharacterized YigZ family protein
MAIHSFFTIQSPSEGIYKESGSKFLSFAYPVSSEDAIKSHLKALHRRYFDARHHCYAWILGPEKSHYRAFDDGEPAHSAGTPILGQIRSKNLTDVLVVVVRYFGGVKLGIGGLTHAYKSAAAGALGHAQIIEKEIYREYALEYSYDETNEVMRLVKSFDLTILHQEFKAECRLLVAVREIWRDPFLEKLELLKSLHHSIAVREIKKSSS